MRLSLLDRWLVKELIGPLLFFIALFTLLLLTGGVMFELVRQMVDKNLPAGIALQVLLLSIPRWMAFSVPIGTLMASLFVFTRLSANNELTALRSLGVSTVRMISAALVLSMLMTLFTFVLNDVVVPRSQRYAEVSLKRALGRSLSSEVGRDIIYPRFGVRTVQPTVRIDGFDPTVLRQEVRKRRNAGCDGSRLFQSGHNPDASCRKGCLE